MIIEIPDEFLKPGYGKEELMIDIAVLLYQRKQTSLRKAAQWVGMNRLAFQQALAERGVAIHYDLDIDLETLRASGLTL
jgi:predicted HTH domain antitoxin